MNCWLLIVKKTWFRPQWEDTVQQWYRWLHEKEKKDEKKRREEEHQKLVGRMMSVVSGGAGLLH